MRKPRQLQSVRNLPKIPQLGGRVRLKLIHSSLVSHWSPSSYPSAQYTVSVKKMSPHWQPQLLWRAMWHHLLHGKVGISLIQQFQIETIIFFLNFCNTSKRIKLWRLKKTSLRGSTDPRPHMTTQELRGPLVWGPGVSSIHVADTKRNVRDYPLDHCCKSQKLVITQNAYGQKKG